jgi:hypothetical protein
MSIEVKSGASDSVGYPFRDLPKLIWALVLFIGGIAYVAMKARRARNRSTMGGGGSIIY